MTRISVMVGSVSYTHLFLNSNGAPKFQDVHVPGQGIAPSDPESELAHAALEEFGSLDNVYESTVPMVPLSLIHI